MNPESTSIQQTVARITFIQADEKKTGATQYNISVSKLNLIEFNSIEVSLIKFNVI